MSQQYLLMTMKNTLVTFKLYMETSRWVNTISFQISSFVDYFSCVCVCGGGEGAKILELYHTHCNFKKRISRLQH